MIRVAGQHAPFDGRRRQALCVKTALCRKVAVDHPARATPARGSGGCLVSPGVGHLSGSRQIRERIAACPDVIAAVGSTTSFSERLRMEVSGADLLLDGQCLDAGFVPVVRAHLVDELFPVLID